MKSLKSCTLLLSTLLLLPGCSTNSPAPTTSSQDLPSSQSSTSGSVDLSQLFSDRDFEIGYDEESAVHIPLVSPSTCDSDAVTVDGSTVTITSQGGHGVVSKDDLVVTCGTYEINVSSHGLSGKDSVAIANGTFTLQTGKDSIQSDNEEDTEKGFVYLGDGNYTITADGDGVSASSWMQIDGGTYTITSGGGSANGEAHTDNMQPGQMGGMGGMGGRRP